MELLSGVDTILTPVTVAVGLTTSMVNWRVSVPSGLAALSVYVV